MSSILQERLVSISMPSSVSAIMSLKSHVPGSSETLVIRISGIRFHPSARIQPLLSKPSFGAEYPIQFGGMPAGFVDLKRKLRAAQDQRRFAARTNAGR